MHDRGSAPADARCSRRRSTSSPTWACSRPARRRGPPPRHRPTCRRQRRRSPRSRTAALDALDVVAFACCGESARTRIAFLSGEPTTCRSGLLAGVGACGCAGRRATGASTTGAAAATSGSPDPPSLRVLRFSTTTDLERPWLKFCRTWPLSTVRCSESGLRPPPRRVLSVVSLVSVMLFSLTPKTCIPAFRMRSSPTDSALSARPGLETVSWLRLV